jgi:hypothetical protein
MEMYTPGKGLQVIPEGERFIQLFPLMHQLSDGRVAHVGPESQTWVFDPCERSWSFAANMIDPDYRSWGTSIEIPNEPDSIMVIGGLADAGKGARTCERIDFSEPTPAWRPTGMLNFGRAHTNNLALPDGKVLVIGGGLGPDLYQNPVLNAELYDPAAETWTLLPAQQHSRMYHSTAVLLPDGRVISAGQDFGQSAFKAEIYEPGYLFRGARPVIGSAPASVTYRQTFTVSTPSAADIASVALIAPTAQTHSVNMGQKYVGLPFTHVGGGKLRVTAPRDGNRAPPGYYMLFVVNSAGVPSVASWVQVTRPAIGTVTCDDVVTMQAGCQNGNLGVRVRLQDSSHHGESVAVAVNDKLFQVPVVGQFARMMTPAAAGPTTVELVDPPGALKPLVVECP